MAAKKRNDIGDLPSFSQRNDRKGASSTGFPIDCKVLRVDLFRPVLLVPVCSLRAAHDVVQGIVMVEPTLTKFVSQAFLLMRRLS
jgi:hypothetical protein